MALRARHVYVIIITAGFIIFLLLTRITSWPRIIAFPMASAIPGGSSIDMGTTDGRLPNSDSTTRLGRSDGNNSNTSTTSSGAAASKHIVMKAAELLLMVKSAAAAEAQLSDSSSGAIAGNRSVSPLAALSQATYHRCNYDVAIAPEPCGDRPMMGVIVVQSLPAQNVRRHVARDTWVREARRLGYRVVFLMGVTADLRSDTLSAEAEKHRDLLLVGFLESYLNLTLKSIIMMDWVAAHCSAAHFLVKVDDDVYLHVGELHTLLTERAAIVSQSGSRRSGGRQIMGAQAAGYKPIRSATSKWYMPMEVFAGAYYPTFAYGPCYVLSTDLLGDLSRACKNISYVPYEDVFVSGICAEPLTGVTRYHRETFIETKCGVPGTVAVHWYSCWQGSQVELTQLYALASADSKN